MHSVCGINSVSQSVLCFKAAGVLQNCYNANIVKFDSIWWDELWACFSQVCVAQWNSEASSDSLVTQDLVQGEGQAVDVGDTVEVAFSGWLLQNHSLGQVIILNCVIVILFKEHFLNALWYFCTDESHWSKKKIMCNSSLHILIQEKFLLLNEAEWINTFPNCTQYVFL